ncbi:MAG: hypothetical protein JNM09_03930 [Blastocatellia bacterium]|nr:hypothetical protein [Blastocatellia bacterium]
MRPEELFESISSREDFMRFLEALIADYGNSTDEWENTSIEHFLEAMHAWATDAQRLRDDPSWRDFAHLLLAGKRYE